MLSRQVPCRVPLRYGPWRSSTSWNRYAAGPYAGAVGYVGWGARTLDTAIAIRTCVMKGGRAWIQAGAGIVADSDPLTEWHETEAKARAVLLALALAGKRGSGEAGKPS